MTHNETGTLTFINILLTLCNRRYVIAVNRRYCYVIAVLHNETGTISYYVIAVLIMQTCPFTNYI